MDVKLRENKKSSIHICPSSGIRVLGDCPNYECPANLVRLTSGKKTGCFYQKFKATITDFSILWNTTEKEAQARYSNSVSTLEKMTTLYKMVGELRERHRWECTCHNCGAPLEGRHISCLNVQKCSSRAKFVNKQRSRIPFSLPGLSTTKVDIWRFVYSYSKQELRQMLGVYFPEPLWELLPPFLQKGDNNVSSNVQRN